MRKPTQADLEAIRLLMDAVRRYPTTIEAPPNVREFDWTEPTRFVGETMEALRDFAVRVTRRVSDDLEELLGEEIDLDEPEMTQFYGQEARRFVADCSDYLMPLDLDGREVGVLILPSRTAVAWVTRLLGGHLVREDEQRDLSHLESEILLECIDCVLAGVNHFLTESGYNALTRRDAVRRKYEIAADKAETYCLIRLPDKQPDGPNNMMFVLPGELLDAPSGLRTGGGRRTGGASDEEKMVLHVENMLMTGRAVLGVVDLPMRGLMSLSPGDVLLTGRRVNQPIELFVQDIPLLIGYPVRSEFNYGLLVSGRPEEDIPQTKDPSQLPSATDDSQIEPPAASAAAATQSSQG